MHAIHDVDVLLLLATLHAAKRRPAELAEIMAALDLVQGNIPAAPKLVEAFARLANAGLLVARDGGYALGADAEKIAAKLPKRAETAERLFIIKDELSMHRASGEQASIALEESEIVAAIAAHRAAATSKAKNLLVPKAKPEDKSAQRPGQRKRKPLPARRRRD